VNHRGIDEQTTDEVSAANLIFLSLIRQCAAAHSHGACFGLQPAAVALIESLKRSALLRLSRCPFALFSLGFEDQESWVALLGRRVSDTGVAHWRANDQQVNQFLLLALASVHSVAARDLYTARLLYGIPETLCEPLARLDLAVLPSLVPAVNHRLQARLAACPDFWRDLLTGVYAGGSDADLSALRHLGLQLTLQRSLGLRGSRSADRRLCRGA